MDLFLRWASFRPHAVTNKLYLYFVEDDDQYHIWTQMNGRILDTVVAKGTVDALDFETDFKAGANPPPPGRDYHGTPITADRPITGTLSVHECQVTTSTLTMEEGGCGYYTVHLYDANGALCDDVPANAVKTVLDFMPDWGYDIYGGELVVVSPAYEKVRVKCIGVPDFTVEQGGSRVFVHNLLLDASLPTAMIRAQNPKYLPFFNAALPTNKVRLELTHAVGVQREVRFRPEVYRDYGN